MKARSGILFSVSAWVQWQTPTTGKQILPLNRIYHFHRPHHLEMKADIVQGGLT
jgi:hypothetical protein